MHSVRVKNVDDIERAPACCTATLHPLSEGTAGGGVMCMSSSCSAAAAPMAAWNRPGTLPRQTDAETGTARRTRVNLPLSALVITQVRARA